MAPPPWPRTCLPAYAWRVTVDRRLLPVVFCMSLRAVVRTCCLPSCATAAIPGAGTTSPSISTAAAPAQAGVRVVPKPAGAYDAAAANCTAARSRLPLLLPCAMQQNQLHGLLMDRPCSMPGRRILRWLPWQHSPQPSTPFRCMLQALALDMGERLDSTDGGGMGGGEAVVSDSSFYEITIATVDQPKLLSRLSDAMVGLFWVQRCLIDLQRPFAMAMRRALDACPVHSCKQLLLHLSFDPYWIMGLAGVVPLDRGPSRDATCGSCIRRAVWWRTLASAGQRTDRAAAAVAQGGH